MKKLAIILILTGIINVVNSQNSDRWFIKKKNGKIGFIDSTGKEIFTGEFDILDREFNSGLVFFQKGKKRGFLDVNGKIAFTSKKIWGSFSENLLKYSDKTGFYYLNTKGKKTIDLQKLKMPIGKEISEIFNFSNGLAMVRIKNIGFDDSYDENSCILYAENINLYPGNWLYGFIDKSGNWAIKPDLESATTFKDSISISERNKTTYLLNTNGEFVIKIEGNIGEFSEGFALVSDIEGYYFINKKGESIGRNKFRKADAFSDGMAAIQIDYKWGFIDTTGAIVIKPKYFTRSDFTRFG